MIKEKEVTVKWCYQNRDHITLCKHCHKQFHDLYGYGHNTYEQFKEFIKSFEGATTIQRWSTIEDELLSEVQKTLIN